MNSRSLVDTVVTAAVVLVIVPLLATIAAFSTSFGIEATAASDVRMFGAMGTPHVVLLLWTIIAVAIVAALVGLLVRDRQLHA